MAAPMPTCILISNYSFSHSILIQFASRCLFSKVQYDTDCILPLMPVVHVSSQYLFHLIGFQYVAPVEEYPTKTWEDMVAIHMTAPFLLVKHFLPLMKRKRKFSSCLFCFTTRVHCILSNSVIIVVLLWSFTVEVKDRDADRLELHQN